MIVAANYDGPPYAPQAPTQLGDASDDIGSGITILAVLAFAGIAMAIVNFSGARKAKR